MTMKVALKDLYCKILVKKNNESIMDIQGEPCYCCGGAKVHRLCKLRDTPHFKFLQGNTESYASYLKKGGRQVGYGLEHSVENFTKLIQNFDVEQIKRFPCHKIDDKFILQDGVHRCCILLHQQLLQEVPVQIRPPPRVRK